MSAINQVQAQDQLTSVVGLYDVADGVNVADVFSSSQAYTAGQIVINPTDALAYEFIVDHAAGAWNANHVTRVKISNEVTDLKSAISNDVVLKNGEQQVTPQNINGVTYTKTPVEVEGDNLFSNDILAGEGKYVAIIDGKIALQSNEVYNTYVLPVDGSKYVMSIARFIVLADGNTVGSNAVGNRIENATSIASTAGASYMFVTFSTAGISATTYIKKVTVEYEYTDFHMPEWMGIDALDERTDTIETTLPKKLDKVIGLNLFNPNDPNVIEGKYFNSNTGTMSTNENFYITGYMEVEAGEKYTSNSIPGGGYDLVFDASLNIVDAFTGSVNWPYTIPANGKYMRLCTSKLTVVKDEMIFNKGETLLDPYLPYTDYKPLQDLQVEVDGLEGFVGADLVDTPFSATASELSGSTVLRVVAPKLKRNYTISFFGKITTVGTLTIGNGVNSQWVGGWIEIDSTTIKVYTLSATTPTLAGTYTHGLNLAGTISVNINVKSLGKCDIVLNTTGDSTTLGGTFVQTDASWFGDQGFAVTGDTVEGKVTASVDDGVYTDCKLSYYGADYEHELWAFGDSYFGHWPKYAIEQGYGNMALTGSSGGQSRTLYRSFLLEVQKRRPKKVLWCMGMNDVDNEDSVNANWLSTYNSLKAYCETYSIELILTTIPNNARLHYYKNQIIKASGLRYVDIAEAVGGEEIGATWYAGLLSADEVHPTTLGDKVIAARFIADVPELMGE